MSLVSNTKTETPTKERYSFSKLNSWWVCPYGWKLKYIDHEVGIGNAFSSYGTFVHNIMERYANGEIEIWDLPQIYEWEFDTAVPEEFPYNRYVSLRDSYYQQGLDFLKSFQGYDNYKILGVEKEFEVEFNDWIFNGIIDLIFEDEDGRLIIRDYKSKASFSKAEEQKEYARQLYLYSMYISDTYGKFPNELQFLMFRKQSLIRIPFEVNNFCEAFRWAQNTVKAIREAFDYPPVCKLSSFNYYAANLCNFRDTCRIKNKGMV